MAVSKFMNRDWLLGWLVPAGTGTAAVQAVALTDTAGVPVGSGAPLAVTINNSGGAATPVSQLSVISAENSRSSVLAANAVFTGQWVDVLAYGSIIVNVVSDQASATNGLSIQQSSDGINADDLDIFTIAASTASKFVIPKQAAFARVVYTNGAVAQGSFRLQTILAPQMPIASAFRPADAMSVQNDFPSVLSAQLLSNGTTLDLQRSLQGAGNTGLGTTATAPTKLDGTGLTKVQVNITTATTTELVALTASQFIRVYKVMLNIAAAQTIDFRSNGVTLNGAPMSFAANGNLVLDFDGEPWFVSTISQNFAITSSTTGAITGVVYYRKEV